MTNDPTKRLSATLAASSFVAVTQILTRDVLDRPLQIAILLFACAIPVLTVSALITLFDFHIGGRAKTFSEFFDQCLALLWPLAMLASLAGLGCLFWHFQPRDGLVFVCSCLVGLCILARAIRRRPRK